MQGGSGALDFQFAVKRVERVMSFDGAGMQFVVSALSAQKISIETSSVR
jgi:hypothetical protein